MITLARHIELLLLEHDCVIVPGLGGFIANHADARYWGEDEHSFLPPFRTIGFNQQLQMNDGLLVQSYMTAYDTSYPFAYLQMEKDVEKLVQELDMKGECVLENIGVLKKGIHQNITFTAPETGALTPSLYGLYSYDIKSLKQVIKEREIEANMRAASAMQIAESKPEITDHEPRKRKKDVVIRLNRHWLDFGISVAAAVLLLFCFSYPALKNVVNETDTVVAAFPMMGEATVPTKPIAHPMQPSRPINVPTAKPASVPTVQPVKTPTSQTTESEVTEVEETHPQVTENQKKETNHQAQVADKKAETAKFSIVLASFVSQQNAETFISRLTKDGYKEGRFVKNGKTSRILYSSYPNEEAARKALQTLRQENPAFSDAWILELD